MKTHIRFLTLLLLLLSLTCSEVLSSKKLLLENYVCNGFGISPITIWHTDSIQKMYPEDVILIRHHYDKNAYNDTWYPYLIDSLGTSEMTLFSLIARDYTLRYVTYIDRKKFDNNSGDMIYPLPNSLYPFIIEELNEKEKLNISVDCSINKERKKLFAKVHAIMLETIDKPLRFNLFVVEDSVMGHGVGWDQYNAISGNEKWLPCPYVNELDTITNFYHRHVVRKCLGGTFGVKGSFENPATAGNYYTHDFQCDIDPRWDMDKLSVVGIVQVYDRDNNDYEVLNAARGVYSDMPFSVSSSDIDFMIIEAYESIHKTFTLKNTSNSLKDFTYSIMKSDRTPDDWSLIEGTFDPISLQPNESIDIKVVFGINETPGIGDAVLSVYEANNSASYVWTEKMTINSKEIIHFHVTDEYGYMDYSLQPMMDEIGRDDIFEVSPDFLMANSDEFPELKTIIWNTGYYLEAMDSVKIAMLVKWNKEDKNIFLGGNAGAIDHLHYYFSEYFGVKYLATYGNDDSYPFTGIPNDPISGFLADTNIIELPRNISFIGISNSEIASKVLKIKVDGIAHYLNDDWTTYDSSVTSDDAVFAAKIEKENARSFIMTKSFYLISSRDTAEILLDNIINWLDGISDVEDYDVSDGKFYLDVFPNPVYSQASIRFAHDDIMPENIEIGLYDIAGRKVKQIFDGIINHGEKQIELDVSDMNAGFYYIILKNNDKSLTCPIIVIR
jgi:hypothetical protein